MMISKKCMYDILYTIANDKAFDIKSAHGNGFYIPAIDITYLHKVLEQYELNTIAYCCFILINDGYVCAKMENKFDYFNISHIYRLTFKGYQLLNSLSCEIETDSHTHQV